MEGTKLEIEGDEAESKRAPRWSPSRWTSRSVDRLAAHLLMVDVVVSAMNQSVLSPAGVQASSIHALWLLMLTVCTVVFVCTLTAVFLAVIRGTGNRSKEE